jgi:hypothetical protein
LALILPGLAIAFLSVPGRACTEPPPSAAATPTREATAVPVAVVPTPDTFSSTIRPILSAHCAPCHEPGGKMYDRLPFDRAEVVASNPEGVLKRLKGQDRETVERWIANRSGDSARP